MKQEIWKEIYDNYQISNFGNLRNKKTLHLFHAETNSKGYKIVKITINGKRKRIGLHRLVAIAFIPNPHNYPQINHIDENPSNNKVENLEWCTCKYNCNYGLRRKKLSLRNSGINNPFYGQKHTETTKAKMRKKHSMTKEGKEKLSQANSEKFKRLKWVNNGSINKRINNVEEFLQQGWQLGRLPLPQIGTTLKKYYEQNPQLKYWGKNAKRGKK